MLCSKHYVHDGSIDQKRERGEREREKDVSFYPTPLPKADRYELTCISVFLLNGLGQSEVLAGNGRVGIKRSQDIYSLISLPAWLWSSYIPLPQATAPDASLLQQSTISGFCKLFTLLVPSDLGIAMAPPCC